jgi:hypothetical protein
MREEVMKKLLALVVVVVTAAGISAAIATASSAPIVITYAKTCVGNVCTGTAGSGGTIEMHITSFRGTGGAAQLTLTEEIRLGNISFTAEMSGHLSPDGFIVLDGTVTEGSFVGAQVHQRSNLVGGTPAATDWTGELQLMPAST